MFVELTVVLKDDSRTYRQKFPLYDSFVNDPRDPIVFKCIEEAKKNFEGDPDEIQIKTHMQVQ